MTESER